MKQSIKNNKSFSGTKQLPKWTIVVSILFYFIILFTNFQINKFEISLTIGEFSINSLSISDILGQLQMFILIVMVIFYRKQGFITAFILSIVQELLLILTIIMFNTYSPVSGLAAQITSISVIIIIYLYLKKLDMNSKIISEYAVTDALTGLPNRRAFNDYLSLLIENYDSKEDNFAVVMVDLDNFKNINDSVGHDSGDNVLCEVAQRLKILQDKNDFIARIGGDEFIIIIKNYGTIDNLTYIVKRYSDIISNRFIVSNNYFYISASIGISLFPKDSQDPSEIFRYADAAMYYSKNHNDVAISMYNRSMTEKIENNVAMEQKIRTALDEDYLYFVLQPQYDTKTKKLRGFEALVRMKDEQGNHISPNLFIPIAEKTGLITRIDIWVIRNAMLFFKNILAVSDTKATLSVNISVLHLLSANFLDEIKQLLDETGFPPNQLEIEITESVFIFSMSKAIETLTELKKMGLHVSLDDFGTGYSSLSYLSKLPIDMIKIDKCFIDELLPGEAGKKYVAAIISIGHILNFSVISEGVESQEQLDILTSLGSDYIQGYIWGKPMLPSDAAKLLGITEEVC
ncbi:diguanylate cyclase (GGDEF)-like protein [Ruminiclostridium sufflavum DSM 19573]|uniref:Diguanylate cyclase (GGDEF)-like protein n=1 Tax=Ruminiclostridium sufflavum DSM 19573 TaxID=1121337 RepID=A0A318XMB4_9FIRM|nr:bifunctional diguanylate cyclase/phosphodiesterase [Ruminiclostridium sufflavum]PYG87623.1 diguanylate cyclase (GGDEF)-like protein [Ruminiclostridium sufflavum DSM 19573]